MTDTIFSVLPIVLLIYWMVRKKSMPSSKALPLTALVTYAIMLIIFRADANLVHANVLKGLLVAWTPVLIIAGAIFLFRTLEATGGLDVLRSWLNNITSNKVAQLMIVGWAFPFLIEGASGFGTPAAIAAPILVGLGFPAVRVAILTLIMNSVPVSFGAIGTPTWFGFSAIDLTLAETLLISFKTALFNSVAGLIIPAIALMFVLKPGTVIRNFGFIFLSTIATIIPYLVVAKFNYEFPALVGGAIGLILTVFFAIKKTGLSESEVQYHPTVGKSKLLSSSSGQLSTDKPAKGALLRASFPIWGTILILIITRIPQLGIKGLLTATVPSMQISLGTLGDLFVSPSLVIGLENIFGTTENWSHSLLYVPSIIPFGLVSLLALWREGLLGKKGNLIFKETITQMRNPTLALFGALVFVSLMMMGGEKSAVTIIGKQLAQITGNSWPLFAAFLGALGSFFSGSATISNLTFGGIQDSIALSLGMERTTILALQSAGAALGNMVCINNIVAVASILAIGDREGYILKKTVIAMLVYGVIVGLAGLIF